MSGPVCLSGRVFVCVATLLATSVIAESRAWAQLPPQPPPTRVNVDALGAQANGSSGDSSVSADGRYVAFASKATNLVSGDTNASSDVFVKDRQTGAIERVSVKSDGTEAVGDSIQPRITPDARFVVFSSQAPLGTLPAQAACGTVPCHEIYIHDRTTGATTLVSVSVSGTEANGRSTSPSISADARYVTFVSGATDLVAEASNRYDHIFLRDRTAGTTTWIDRPAGGSQGFLRPTEPVISADGSTIAFEWWREYVWDPLDHFPCRELRAGTCYAVYLFDRPSGTLSHFRMNNPALQHATNLTNAYVGPVALSADGQTVAFQYETQTLVTEPDGFQTVVDSTAVITQDRRTNYLRVVTSGYPMLAGSSSNTLAIDASGRVVATCQAHAPGESVLLRVIDVVTGSSVLLPSGATPPGPPYYQNCSGVSLSADGNVLVFASDEPQVVANDTNAASDVFVVDRDSDHDGMPDDWERTFGLNPADPTDAALDPDGDGQTSLQEYVARTDPNGKFTRYLAEGVTNSFFTTQYVVFNPNDAAATVLWRLLGDSGSVTVYTYTIPPKQQLFLLLPPVLLQNEASFSSVFESDRFVAVERTVSWGGTNTTGDYGSHAETGIEQTSTTWYFAEGATHGRFDLFYLLQNPNDTATTATITYLLPAGQPPIVRDYELAAHSRRTIWVDEEPGLGATDVSAKIVAGAPILAERAMYFSTADQTFAGGTGGAGIPQPATKWFVAEGTTGTFFDLYLLIGNPSAQDANVTVTYLLDNGTSFDKQYVVATESRLTISVKAEDPRLAWASVSSVITSTNDVPIIAERAMWWPSPNWYEGHLTAATTDTATAWVLADGRVGVPISTDTYLLVANPGDTTAHVTFDLTGLANFNPIAAMTCTKTVDVPPHSRYTAGLHDMCLPNSLNVNTAFGGVIRSDGPGIVVERSTYTSTPTQFWASGSSTALSKLPAQP